MGRIKRLTKGSGPGISVAKVSVKVHLISGCSQTT